MSDAFVSSIQNGYSFKGESFVLGAAMLNNEPITNCFVKIPLATLNRHGLIAGATGTGKTKTIQVITEGLAENGISVLVMDIKGDFSGIAACGKSNAKIEERHQKIGLPYSEDQFKSELLSISAEPGVKLKATVSEFGPVLFSKILGVNETQEGIITVIFRYCDLKKLPLLDLKDFKKVLNFIGNEGKEEIEAEFGAMSSVSLGTILRKVVELEQQGADSFFGEPSFDVEDLMRMDENGRGIINIIRLGDIQDKPKMFSTFMLCLLAEIYNSFPEEGDLDRPKLVLFIDEAHLIFNEASKALMDQIETIIKLIRSKGVGIFFCTQNPQDIPDAVLSQLGMKVQHALRAFTANDRKAIKRTSENYPLSDFYKTDELLTAMGIGECLVTVLDEKGRPSPLAHTLLRAPRSRMDVLTDGEISYIVDASPLVKKYNKIIDRESAYEILTAKIEAAQAEAAEQEEEKKESKSTTKTTKEKSTLEKMTSNPMVKSVGNTLMREVTRGLLGVLGIKSSSSSRKKSSWF